MITKAMRTTPTKVLMLLNLPQLGSVVETRAPAAAYHLLRTNQKTPKIGHTRIWIKAEKVDSGFTILKAYVYV